MSNMSNNNNILSNLWDDSISPSEWCEQIIKEQKKEVYTSLTAPKDFNHIVKANVLNLHRYLREQGITSFKDLDSAEQTAYAPFKEALRLLYGYLQTTPSWKPSVEQPLAGEALDHAFKDLHVNQVVSPYLKCDRKFADPQINGQNYALYSFTPSNGVKPDSDGLYGFIKVRGVFGRIEEAEERSKELIQYFSANQVFICDVGKPVPLEHELTNKENIIEIDHPDREEKNIKFAELIGDQTIKEKKEIENILKKEELLKADVAKGPEDKDPIQKYIELIHKRATCAYLYTQHQEKMEETKNIILRTRQQIADMDLQHPNLKDEYMEHYLNTAKECGIDKATDNMAVMIKNYIGRDPDLGF